MFRELPENFSSAIDSELNSVLLRTARFDAANSSSYLFRDCRKTLIARSLDEIPALFTGIEEALRDGLYVAGYLSYECGGHFEPRGLWAGGAAASPDELPLAWFGVYAAPVIFDHSADSSQGGAAPIRSAPGGMTSAESRRDGATVIPELEISSTYYRAGVERIKRYIEAGDSYQVNFTTEVKMPYSGAPSEVLSSLLHNQPVAYGAVLNLGETQIVSASPELFFRVENDRITTRPMKGTAARGKDVEEDATIAAWLAHDEKNRSENVMIVDLLRSDLGRICASGTIEVEELFAVERYRTLFQMTSTVSGRLRAGPGYYEIFKTLFPSGSIVGAPKVRTMQIIEELEQRRRGIYTGAIGFISPEREAVFSVAIRTLVLRDGMAEMGVGSGIVYDSDADEEYQECRLKAAFLTRSVPEFELIETMLWDGEYFLLELHLDRMAASAEYFDFVFHREGVVARLQELQLGFAGGSKYRVRMLLAASGAIQLMSVILKITTAPVSVVLASERVFSDDLYLRHKTTHRAVYDHAYQGAMALGYDDALFLNERGEVAEGAIHNVFVEKDGLLLTPPLATGVLPGVYRRHLLETRADVVERVLTLDDLRLAGRVFLGNSVRGLREVGSLRLADGTELLRVPVVNSSPA